MEKIDCETIEKVSCIGYSKCNNYKAFIRFCDGEYKYFVKSEFTYRKTTSTKAYDIKGNYLGFFDKESFFSKYEEKEVLNQLSVVQINYKFYLLPVGRAYTIDEIKDCYSLLSDSFKVKLRNRDVRDLVCPNDCIDTFHESKWKKMEECFTPLEISVKGHSRHIENKTYKKTFDLDIKQYTKDKDKFIKENPDFKDSVEYLYKSNIGFLMSFWNVSKKQILSDKFDKNKASIDKLNRKINLKIKNR